MTPAINYAKKHKIPFTIHKYKHDQGHESYGIEAAEALGLPSGRVFKTLVVQLDARELAVAIVPVTDMLNMKLFAGACGAKKAAMADKDLAQRSTGYVLGGVSPLGQKKNLRTVLHYSAANYQTVFVSAGRRGLEIELSPEDLVKYTQGSILPIC